MTYDGVYGVRDDVVQISADFGKSARGGGEGRVAPPEGSPGLRSCTEGTVQ